MLNGRVRNGNGWDHPGILTGNTQWQRYKFLPDLAGTDPEGGGSEKRINAAKRSAVSTGQLSALLHVHLRPIDLVVFQEPSLRKEQETSSCGGFHA